MDIDGPSILLHSESSEHTCCNGLASEGFCANPTCENVGLYVYAELGRTCSMEIVVAGCPWWRKRKEEVKANTGKYG